MEKQIIQIGLEFVFGPLLKDNTDEYGNENTGIKIIDNDSICNNLNDEINNLWCSLYSEDKNTSDGLRFDSVKEKELAPLLLEKIGNLISRLNEINDGSFEIEDMITDYLKSLVK